MTGQVTSVSILVEPNLSLSVEANLAIFFIISSVVGLVIKRDKTLVMQISFRVVH